VDEEAIRTAYLARFELLSTLALELENGTREAVEGLKHIDRIVFRVKEPNSFVEKAVKPKDSAPDEPRYAAPLSEIEDQVAGRVITFFKDDIPLVRDQLEPRFGAVEYTVKEPEEPDEFGYESDHFVFIIPQHLKPDGWGLQDDMPTTFELQIRTLFMHAWAEPQHDLGYKPNEIDRQSKRELAWVAASAWGADRMLNDVANRLGAFQN
jgi:ppGpp synthetase/RelA/SpoT-type nucleotidyltranferase